MTNRDVPGSSEEHVKEGGEEAGIEAENGLDAGQCGVGHAWGNNAVF